MAARACELLRVFSVFSVFFSEYSFEGSTPSTARIICKPHRRVCNEVCMNLGRDVFWGREGARKGREMNERREERRYAPHLCGPDARHSVDSRPLVQGCLGGRSLHAQPVRLRGYPSSLRQGRLRRDARHPPRLKRGVIFLLLDEQLILLLGHLCVAFSVPSLLCGEWPRASK